MFSMVSNVFICFKCFQRFQLFLIVRLNVKTPLHFFMFCKQPPKKHRGGGGRNASGPPLDTMALVGFETLPVVVTTIHLGVV